jgi:hypothetical protein
MQNILVNKAVGKQLLLVTKTLSFNHHTIPKIGSFLPWTCNPPCSTLVRKRAYIIEMLARVENVMVVHNNTQLNHQTLRRHVYTLYIFTATFF